MRRRRRANGAPQSASDTALAYPAVPSPASIPLVAPTVAPAQVPISAASLEDTKKLLDEKLEVRPSSPSALSPHTLGSSMTLERVRTGGAGE